jgi:RNA-directed DNA polymerase
MFDTLTPAQLVEHYQVFMITQGSKKRLIQAPSEELKDYQRQLIPLFNSYPFYPGCTARVGMSVLDNAAPHHNAVSLFKTDLKQFYPSVTLEHLLRNIDRHDNEQWKEEVRTKVLHCLIAVEGRLVLPTGAPTSPILSCIAASDLDVALALLASTYGFVYTRYIDDLTFTSKEIRDERFGHLVTDTIRQFGFRCNRQKTQWVYPDSNKTFAVTGVALNRNNNSLVPKEIRRKVRARLDKIALNNIPLDSVTQGYLAYIRMIDQSAWQKMTDYLEKRKARYVSSQ